MEVMMRHGAAVRLMLPYHFLPLMRLINYEA